MVLACYFLQLHSFLLQHLLHINSALRCFSGLPELPLTLCQLLSSLRCAVLSLLQGLRNVWAP